MTSLDETNFHLRVGATSSHCGSLMIYMPWSININLTNQKNVSHIFNNLTDVLNRTTYFEPSHHPQYPVINLSPIPYIHTNRDYFTPLATILTNLFRFILTSTCPTSLLFVSFGTFYLTFFQYVPNLATEYSSRSI